MSSNFGAVKPLKNLSRNMPSNTLKAIIPTNTFKIVLPLSILVIFNVEKMIENYTDSFVEFSTVDIYTAKIMPVLARFLVGQGKLIAKTWKIQQC